MKKRIGLIVVFVLLAGCLSGCGQIQGTCERCGEEKPLFVFTEQSEDGTTITSGLFCEDCAAYWKKQVEDMQEEGLCEGYKITITEATEADAAEED